MPSPLLLVLWMFPLLVPLLSLIATTIVIAPRMFLATRANHVVEALEAVAVLLSQGKRITAANEAVSADLKIPYGNFARWMKNMKRIEVPPWLFLRCMPMSITCWFHRECLRTYEGRTGGA